MLETEIKKLSGQIEQLNNNFARFFGSQANTVQITAEEVEQAIDEDQKELERSEASTLSKDNLRTLCLEKSRADKDNKKLIKAILSKHGAKLVDDLDEDNLPKAFKEIGAL
jgi:hypothetical protein